MPTSPFPSLRRNVLLNALVSLVNFVYPLVTLTWVSRVLGPEPLGRFYIALSLGTFFALAAGLGLPLYGAREIAKVRNDRPALDRLFSELFLLNGAASLIATIVLGCVILLVPDFRVQAPLFFLVGSIVLLNVFAVDFLLMGLEEYSDIARRSVATKAVSLGLLFCLVRGPGDLMAYAGITVLTAALYGLWGVRSALIRARLSPAGTDLRRHFKPLSLIGANVAIVSLYTNLDSVLLGLLSDAGKVGLYNAGMKVERILIALIVATGMAVIPRFASYLSRDMHEEFAAAAGKSLGFICLLTFPAMAFLAAAAPEICRLAFGPAFDGAVPVIRIAAPIVVVIGFTHFIGMQVLFPQGGEKTLLVSVAVAALVGVGLNLALVPRFGHVGAAWALLAAETAVLCVQWPAFRRKAGGRLSLSRHAMTYALACPLAALPAPFLRMAGLEQPWLLPAAFGLGAALYAGLLFLLRDSRALELAELVRARFQRP